MDSLLEAAPAEAGELRVVQRCWQAAFSESHVPCFQARVDTGTLFFCPVVVVSQGSSLNHSS